MALKRIFFQLRMDYQYANTLLHDKLDDADEERVDRLFVNLKPKDKDSKKWNDQIKFWSRLIKSWEKETGIIEFSLDELTQTLIFNDLLPQLKPTIEYLCSIGLLKTRENLYTTKSFFSSLSDKLFGFMRSSSIQDQDKFIFVDNLKNKVDCIIEEVERDAVYTSDIILTTKELEAKFRDDKKYPFDLILAQLDRDKRVKKYSNGYYFNVGDFSETDFGDDVIHAIFQTKESIAKLNDKINVVDKQIDNDLNSAKSFKKQNRLKEAKSALVHKKMLENIHDNYYKMKSNLEAQLNQFEQGHTIKKVTNTLKNVNEAMKTIEMPSVEDVDKIMDEMQDFKDIQDELADAFQAPELANLDDDEIEDELANLPNSYEELVAAKTPQKQSPQGINVNIFQAPEQPQTVQFQTMQPQMVQPQMVPPLAVQPAKLKTPKQLAQNQFQ